MRNNVTARAKQGELRALRAEGLPNRVIADRLGISERSVYRVLQG
ncbi:helix-turn-helix domain-containing protein [uncultured Jannaschia sp.]|nr:helix-turn-helix domain-containing protein [uncultured Jannaschia sp.]